jgi:hypothetical protein
MTVGEDILSRPGPPWCVTVTGTAQEVAGRAHDWAQSGFTVRFLRGRKMATYQGLFDECAAALQFPWYFGENGNAFDECMTDLSWLPPQQGYVLVVTEPALVLSATGDDGLTWLVMALGRAAAEWSQPVREGEPWDRPPVPFHVVLHTGRVGDGAAAEAWAAAGAEPVSL